MSAPNYDELFSFEKYLETACVTIQKANGIPNAFRQRDSSIKKTPWTEVQYEGGAITGHMSFNKAGENVYDAWNGNLIFTVNTERKNNNAQHDIMRAKIRYLFMYFKAKFTTIVLPYHQVTAMTEARTNPSILTDKEVDVSAISFDIILNIRQDAWPEV